MAWKNNSIYSKAHPGQFALLIDWETSGSDFGGDSSETYQGITFGAVVFELATFEEVDSLYREMYFDSSKYKWSAEAEKIHGKSQVHLAVHGMPRDEALADLIELTMKYWPPGSKILMAGHNVSFDNDFTMQLYRDHGLEHAMKIHHVIVDTSGIGLVLIGEYKSDKVFELLGGLSERKEHNALEDARATLAVLKNAKQIFTTGLYAS